MDPLSISASIAGITSLAEVVFRSTKKYFRAARGSQQEIEAISLEVKNLALVLHNLSLVALSLEDAQLELNVEPPTTGARLLEAHHLHSCRQVLKRLEDALEEPKSLMTSNSPIQRLRGRLTWPFSSTETKEILQELQRQKQTLELALTAESLASLKLCLTRQENANARLRDLQVTVGGILHIQTQVIFNEKRQKVIDFFLPTSPGIEYETNIKLRHSMTGLWFTHGADFEAWLSSTGTGVWCSGIPGGGKSVLAACTVEECLRRSAENPRAGVAYFFCTHRNPATHTAEAILSGLCAQLTLQNELAFGVLEAYYDELKDRLLPVRQPTVKRLSDTLHAMAVSFDCVALVVDGLDECSDHTQDSVSALVGLISSSNVGKLRVAMFSRDEITIREKIGPEFRHVEIQARTEDLQMYVLSELESRIASRKLRMRDPKLKDQLLNGLVIGAKGMFRWVVCQLDHICDLSTDRERKEALAKFPPTLFASYERLLMRIDAYHDTARELVRKTLIILASPRSSRLTLPQLCEAVSLSEHSETLTEDDVVLEEEMMQRCGSLVRTSTGPNGMTGLEFAHFTVREYLELVCVKHPTLNRYAVSEKKASEMLGTTCLQYLVLEDRERALDKTSDEIERIKQRARSGSLYEHAAMYWPRYLQETDDGCTGVMEAVRRLFDVRKTPQFSAWAVEMIRHCLVDPNEELFSFRERSDFGPKSHEVIASVFRADFTPLHMAAALGLHTLCRELISSGADPNLQSKFGTPLHFAVGTLHVFMDLELEDLHDFSYGPWDWISATGRLATLQLFLMVGVNLTPRLSTPFRSSETTVLSLAVITSMLGLQFSRTTELLQAGAEVTEEDLACFQTHYNMARGQWTPWQFKQEFRDGYAIISLAELLVTNLRELSDQDGASLRLKKQLLAETNHFLDEMLIMPAGNDGEKAPLAVVVSGNANSVCDYGGVSTSTSTHEGWMLPTSGGFFPAARAAAPSSSASLSFECEARGRTLSSPKSRLRHLRTSPCHQDDCYKCKCGHDSIRLHNFMARHLGNCQRLHPPGAVFTCKCGSSHETAADMSRHLQIACPTGGRLGTPYPRKRPEFENPSMH